MPVQAVSTDAAPAAIGPYSQAVRAGDFLFLSGQIPLDPATGVFVPGGVQAQTEQVIRNILAVLSSQGLGLEAIVKTTVFLTNMGDFPAVNAVYAEQFGSALPARSAVGVAALPKDALVEIECIAYAGA